MKNLKNSLLLKVKYDQLEKENILLKKNRDVPGDGSKKLDFVKLPEKLLVPSL